MRICSAGQQGVRAIFLASERISSVGQLQFHVIGLFVSNLSQSGCSVGLPKLPCHQCDVLRFLFLTPIRNAINFPVHQLIPEVFGSILQTTCYFTLRALSFCFSFGDGEASNAFPNEYIETSTNGSGATSVGNWTNGDQPSIRRELQNFQTEYVCLPSPFIEDTLLSSDRGRTERGGGPERDVSVPVF